MQYRYTSQDQFELTKAFLKKPAAGISSAPRSLLDAMNYGASFPGFHTKVKFYSRQAGNLKTGTAPLPLREPQTSGKRDLPDENKSANAGIEAASASHDPEIQFKQASSIPPGLSAIPDEPAIKGKVSRLASPMVSGALGICVAVAVGAMIASSSSFKLKTSDPLVSTGVIQGVPAESNATTDSSPANVSLKKEPVTISEQAMPAAGNAAAYSPTDNASAMVPIAPGPKSGETAESAIMEGNKAVPETASRPETLAPPVKPAQKNRGTTASKQGQANLNKSRPANPQKSRSATSGTAPERAPAPRKKYSDQEPSYTAEFRSKKRNQYARCEQVSGLFQREKCRWKACSGKWGKDGCPSYQHPPNPFTGAGTVMATQRNRIKTSGSL